MTFIVDQGGASSCHALVASLRAGRSLVSDPATLSTQRVEDTGKVGPRVRPVSHRNNKLIETVPSTYQLAGCSCKRLELPFDDALC